MSTARQLMKSLLAMHAVNELALHLMDDLDGSGLFDNKSQKAIQKCIGVIESSLEKNHDLFRSEEVQQGLIFIYKFLETWTGKAVQLSEDDLVDLNDTLDIFFRKRNKLQPESGSDVNDLHYLSEINNDEQAAN